MNNSQYENLIELLKKALEYYANENNYKRTVSGYSPMDFEHGSQAQFALDKINELKIFNQKIEKDYDKLVEEGLSTWGTTTNLEDIEQIIKENKVTNNDTNI